MTKAAAMWVLVVVLTVSSIGSPDGRSNETAAMQEFPSEARCEEAKSHVKGSGYPMAVIPIGLNVHAECMEK